MSASKQKNPNACSAPGGVGVPASPRLALYSFAYMNSCQVQSGGMPLCHWRVRVTQPLMQVDERGLCLPSLAAGP